MTRRSFLFALPLCALILLGQGCFGGSSQPTGADGGIFKTVNNGQTWQQVKTVAGPKAGSIANLNIATIAIDPQDQKAVYIGTTENGLLTSLDGGESWTTSKAPEVSAGKIHAIAVHPKDKCTVFVARSNQLLKTTNCERDWSQAFFNPQTDAIFTALSIDWFNPKIMYAGTSNGQIFRSLDGGQTWSSVANRDEVITSIVLDPKDSRIVYAGANNLGLLKSTDGGTTWQLIRNELAAFDNARRITAIVMDPNAKNTLYTVSSYGILRSADGGATWTDIPLPTPGNTVTIRGMAVSPQTSKFLVYVTDSSVVMSNNAGTSWTSRKLPTTRGTTTVIFDKSAEPAIYIGTTVRKTN
ncbi:MAG: YCF48-related protein [bacterium]|nr:YCF48-related protein [bacterium]